MDKRDHIDYRRSRRVAVVAAVVVGGGGGGRRETGDGGEGVGRGIQDSAGPWERRAWLV